MSREKPAWLSYFLPAPSPAPCWGWTIPERVSLLLWKEWKRNIILTFYGKPRLCICSWVGWVFYNTVFTSSWPRDPGRFTSSLRTPHSVFKKKKKKTSRMKESLTRMTLVAVPFKRLKKITSRCRGSKQTPPHYCISKAATIYCFLCQISKMRRVAPFHGVHDGFFVKSSGLRIRPALKSIRSLSRGLDLACREHSVKVSSVTHSQAKMWGSNRNSVTTEHHLCISIWTCLPGFHLFLPTHRSGPKLFSHGKSKAKKR